MPGVCPSRSHAKGAFPLAAEGSKNEEPDGVFAASPCQQNLQDADDDMPVGVTGPLEKIQQIFRRLP